MSDFLFNSAGQWIAVITDDKYVFDPSGRWVGWMPWGDDDVATPDGTYLGTRYGDRLYYQLEEPEHGAPAGEPSPSQPEALPRPPRMQTQPTPPGTRNVDLGL